jgi:fimbrial chaperone protein
VPAGAEQTVRLVRTSGAPVKGEEAYRVFVDELPAAGKIEGRTVTLLMRHSIPLFVDGVGATRSAVIWRVMAADGAYQLWAVNQGDRRLRLADLQVRDATGRPLAAHNGLLGYVLGQSTGHWSLPMSSGADAGAAAKLSLDTDQGHIDIAVPPPAP